MKNQQSLHYHIPSIEEQEELVRLGYATKKVDANRLLATFKYHRKVMYEYLWNKVPNIMECRGHTYCMQTGEVVSVPFRKTFAYLENGNWSNVSLDTEVEVHKKYNGFMAAVSVRKVNGEMQAVVSSTGTTTSDYVEIAKQKLNEKFSNLIWYSGYTYMFEICAESDPHIVYEKPGAYYTAMRNNDTGVITATGEESPQWITLREAIELSKNSKCEGFMLYDEQGNCCKLKTPYYVNKKKLMRLNGKNISRLYAEGLDFLDESWHDLAHKLIREVWEADFRAMTDQQRRKVIENLLGE